MAVKKTIEIDVRTEESVQEVNNLTTSIQKADRQTEALNDTTDTLVDALDNMTGGAITAFRGIVSGAKKGVIAMQSLKVAIAATGIGLLVIAVGTLISYFTQTQRGADKVSKAFAAIGATIDVLKDRVSQFGEGMALIFDGKFRQGAKLLALSMVGVATEIKNESKAAWDLDEALKSLEDREIALITVNAKREQQIKDLRLEAQKSMQDQERRGQLLREAMRIQDEMYNEEVKIAKERARISQEQLDLGESTREEIRATRELQADVIRLEAERADRQRELQSELNGTIQTEKEYNEVLRQRKSIEGVDSELTPEGTQELDIFKELQKSKFETLEEYQQREEALRRRTAEITQYIEREKANAIIDLTGQTAGAVANILGRNSALGKAAGIAQALINTYQGITEVWKTPSALPEPAATLARIASTVTVGASGFAAVKNIQGIKLPSFPGGGGGSSSGNSPRTQAPPAPSFNIVGNSQANQLGEAINRDNSPVRAYVVSTEMTTQQQLDRNIRTTASVG